MLIELAQAAANSVCWVQTMYSRILAKDKQQIIIVYKQHTTRQSLQSSSTLTGIWVGVADLQVSQSLHCSWAPTIV